MVTLGFHHRLMAARHAQQLTQHALAELVGTHRNTINRLELAKSQTLTVALVQQLGPALDVSLDWLFLGIAREP
jgi:transcriptional regulator with XRE-family HTH domain